jgi:hypothetical protein
MPQPRCLKHLSYRCETDIMFSRVTLTTSAIFLLPLSFIHFDFILKIKIQGGDPKITGTDLLRMRAF